MQIENTERRWGIVQQTLHWVVAAAVVAQILVGLRFASLAADDPQRAAILPIHATVGLSILILMVFRWFWRRSHPVPKLPDTLTPGQKRLAHITHYTLYGLLVFIPIVGYFLASAYGQPVPFFRAELPAATGENPSLQYSLGTLHAAGAFLLVLVLALHISGALRHAWTLRDGVMARMAPWLHKDGTPESAQLEGEADADPGVSTAESAPATPASSAAVATTPPATTGPIEGSSEAANDARSEQERQRRLGGAGR